MRAKKYMKHMKPGGWSEVRAEDRVPAKQTSPQEEPKLEFGDDSIKAVYTAFRDKVYNPESVLYPSCGFDASPSRVFGNVTFVDKDGDNQRYIRKFQEAGFQAFKQDIRLYRPAQRHDLLILMNPYIPTDWATPYLKSGGYVLANNYHLNASWLNSQEDRFSLVGVIDSNQDTGSARIIMNREDELSRAVSIESIVESRPIEHKAFMDHKKIGRFSGLPFEREAYMYVFMKH